MLAADSPPTSLFHIQTGGPHFTETAWIMAKDRAKQSIRNVLPGDTGETNNEDIKRPQFLLATKTSVTPDWRHAAFT